MQIEFKLDPKKEKLLKKNGYKKHPLWKKWKTALAITTPLSWVLFVFMLIGTYMSVGQQNSTRLTQNIMTFFLLAGVLCIPMLVFSLYTKKSILWKASDMLTNKGNDSLFLTDSEIVYAYQIYEFGPKSRHVMTIPYSSIDKLIYNKYHERLMIIGEGTLDVYDDYVNGIRWINPVKNDNKISMSIIDGGLVYDGAMILYNMYDQFEDFLELVQKRTGKNIQYINTPEAISRSKYSPAGIYDQIR